MRQLIVKYSSAFSEQKASRLTNGIVKYDTNTSTEILNNTVHAFYPYITVHSTPCLKKNCASVIF